MPEIVISGCAELPDMANVNRVTTDHSGSLESMAETSSTVSSTAESEHPVHKLSLLNILEMTELFPNSSDLESEQEDIMAETMSSISNHQQQQQDRTDKAHKVESAIKAVSIPAIVFILSCSSSMPDRWSQYRVTNRFDPK